MEKDEIVFDGHIYNTDGSQSSVKTVEDEDHETDDFLSMSIVSFGIAILAAIGIIAVITFGPHHVG